MELGGGYILIIGKKGVKEILVRIGKEKTENIFTYKRKNRILGEKGEKPRTRGRSQKAT